MIRRTRTVMSLAAVVAVATACSSGTVERADPTAVEGAPASADASSTDTVDGADEEIATGADTADSQDAASETEAEAVDAADDEEPAAPEALWWTAPTVDGPEFVAADLAGQDVVLWMWAPWCSVCNREAPEVAEVIADLPDDVTIIGVAGRDDVGPMQDFIAEHGLEGITHVVDEDGAVWASYGISYQPAWVFIDDTGAASVAAGALGYDGILAGVEQVFGS